jgi:cell division septal protein FtsQ
VKASPELPFSRSPDSEPAPRRNVQKRSFDYFGLMGVMILSSALWQIWMAPFWQIKEVRPHGLSNYSTRYVLGYLNSKKLEGKHMLQVNPLELRKELLDYPLLKDVRVERSFFPSLINVFATERKPAYRLFFEAPNLQAYSTEHSFLIDEEGVLLNIPDTNSPAYKVLTSIEKKAIKKGKLSPEHLLLLNQLNQLYQNKQLNIQGVYNLTNPENIILRSPELNTPVWLGKAENLPVKLGLLDPVREISKKQPKSIDYIDLRFWKHPVLRTH